MRTALLIEDHLPTQQWLKQVIMDAFPGIDVVLAETLQQARLHLSESQFGIALVDINLPDGSGIELITEMIQSNRVGYIVMSTIFDDDNHLFTAIRAGAHGFLLKDQPASQLVEKLEGILRGDPPLSPGIARRLLAFHRQVQHQPREKQETSLSNREEEVITLLAKGVTTKGIAQLLDITANTASGYVKSAYRKLNVCSRAEASLKAVELGLVNSSAI